MEVTVEQESARYMIGHDYRRGLTACSVLATIGHHAGAPFFAPFINCSLAVGKVGNQGISIGAMAWPTWFVYREPEHWRNNGTDNPEPLFFTNLWGARTSVGGVTLSLTYLNFLDEQTNWLPGVAYTHPLRKDVTVTGSATLNSITESMMYFIGATWRPGT